MSSSTAEFVPSSLPTAEQVPPELRGLKRWVGWRAVLDEKKGKWRKPPASPVDGSAIAPIAKYEHHWLTFDEARAGVEKNRLTGLGFVFVEADGFVGIDFDDCRTQEGAVHQATANWLKWLPSFAEVSPSGTGIHIIARGGIGRALTATFLPGGGDTKVEVYNRERYFTFTGDSANGILDIVDCKTGLNKLLEHLGASQSSAKQSSEKEVRSISALSAKRVHRENLKALRSAPQGSGNATLNTTSFFAARAFVAGVLDGTKESIQRQLLDIVTKEWKSPHPYESAKETINSGWRSGESNPLTIAEENYPEVAALIEDFNQKFFIVENFGGKCRVCWEDKNSTVKDGESYTLGHQSRADFKFRFEHQLIQTGEKDDGQPRMEDRATVWLRSKHRRQYREVVFLPNHKVSVEVKNLWRGFAFEPRKGDCSLYLEHLSKNICRNDRTKYRYLINWMAYAVRHPDEQGHVAVVIQGLKGVGKNVAAEGYSALWGQHGMVVGDQTRVTGNFNSHLRDKCVLVADEAFFAGDKKHERVLKHLITGNTLTIEAKGVDTVVVPNLLRLIIIGNEKWLIRASGDERRYLVLRCGSDSRMNTAYFDKINRQLKSGGYEALLYHLMSEVDLSDFDIRQAPHTDELREQMSESLDDVEDVWHDCLYNGTVPGYEQRDGKIFVQPSMLLEWASRNRVRFWRNLKPQHLGFLLGETGKDERKGMGFPYVQLLIADKRPRGYMVSTLKEARKRWNELRYEETWPDIDSDWDTIENVEERF